MTDLHSSAASGEGDIQLSNVVRCMQSMPASARRIVFERQISILNDAVKECRLEFANSSNVTSCCALSLRLVELTEQLSGGGGGSEEQSEMDTESDLDSVWKSVIERFPTSLDISLAWCNYKRSIFINFSGNVK